MPVRPTTEAVPIAAQEHTKQVPRLKLLLALLVRQQRMRPVEQQPARLGPSAMQAPTIPSTQYTKIVPVAYAVLVPLLELQIDLLAVKPVPVGRLQPHRAQQCAKRGP